MNHVEPLPGFRQVSLLSELQNCRLRQLNGTSTCAIDRHAMAVWDPPQKGLSEEGALELSSGGSDGGIHLLR